MVCKTSFLRILSREVSASAVLERAARGREYSRSQTMILQPGVHKSEWGNPEESKPSRPWAVGPVVGLQVVGWHIPVPSEKLRAPSLLSHSLSIIV